MKDSYSILIFETLHNLHSATLRILRSYLIQYLLCNEVCSHPLGPAEKRTMLSSLDTSLSEACSGILAHVEEKCALPGLPVTFARKNDAHSNSLLTGYGLRGMLEGKGHSVVDIGFPFVA